MTTLTRCAALLLALLLTSCVASPAPPYFVGVGNTRPRCGGYAIGPYLVLTAAHCTQHGFSTVFVGGETIQGKVAAQWPEIDLALLETESAIDVPAYASLVSNDTRFGTLYGFCPLRTPGRTAVQIAPANWGDRAFLPDLESRRLDRLLRGLWRGHRPGRPDGGDVGRHPGLGNVW